MAKLSVTAVLALAVLTALCLGPISCGGGEEGVTGQITWRLNHTLLAKSTQGETAQKFADMVDEATEGRLKIKVYPNAMLYGTYADYEAATTGAVDCIMISNYFLKGTLPYLNLFYVAFLWEDGEHIHRFVKSAELNDRIRAEVESFGLYHLGLLPISEYTCFINATREVRDIPDFEGMRFGLIAGSGGSPTDAYAGWIPIEVEYSERLTALSTGVIEVGADTVINVAAGRWWDYGGKHGLLGVQACPADMFLVNLNAWNSLPADIQDIITDEVMPQLFEDAWQRVCEDEAAAIEQLGEHLETLHTITPEARAGGWEVIKEYSATRKWLDVAGPEVVELVDELRPSRD